MSKKWEEWEKKVGEVFSFIEYSLVEGPPDALPENSFCFERINPEMQVDVFVRVDRTNWIAIECRDRRHPTLKKWMHEIKGRCEDRASKLRKKLKLKGITVHGVAAASLKTVDPEIQQAAMDTGVALWHHGVVDYLRAIARGARSQVRELVLQRCGITNRKYDPIRLDVLEWPGKKAWYIGFVSPLEIAHATFVYQRGQGFGESAYQRFLKPARIAHIADYIRSDRAFPNSVVLALPPRSKIVRRHDSSSGLCVLECPGEPDGIKIIDGQHRFFGALASGRNPRLLCALVEADDLEQAMMFATVNGKQVTVSKSQLISLFGIPGFAARIAEGAAGKERDRVERDEACYRALEQLNLKGPLAGRLNFYPGRPAEGLLPFKTLYDTLRLVTGMELSGFDSLKGSPKQRGVAFGDRMAGYLRSWSTLLGSKFDDPKRWFQPTMLSALLLTYPHVRHAAIAGDAGAWLQQRGVDWSGWQLRPEMYRGAAGTRRLSGTILRRLALVDVRRRPVAA